MNFRPDIEGLRAVAVLLVVAAHAKLLGFEGGYIGVDVFFVLSGYLITGLLLKELEHKGRIDWLRFYARRFRRLFPALLLVLACSALLAQQLLPADDQKSQALAAASAVVWLSNFYFALSSFDYFGSAAESNLFLHTWSLGVEEQFYLIWPLLLLLMARMRALRWLMPAVAALGFAACVAWTAADPVHAFYLMPARIWQFALGACVFLFCSSAAVSTKPAITRATGWLGLVAIIAAALLLDGQITYPGAWAALPSLGAAAVLGSGALLPGSGVAGLLSRAPMLAIGRVSYAWYLWHWPVLLLGAEILDFERADIRAGLALLSLLLALATHRCVEAPLRDAVRWPWPPKRVVFATLALMIAANGLALRWHNDARQQMQTPQLLAYQQVRQDLASIYAMGCDEWYYSDAVRICQFGADTAEKTAVAIGDSIGLQWFPALEAALLPRGWRLLVITKSACPMVDEPIFYERIGRIYEECSRWRAQALRQVAQLRPQLVIVGSTYTYKLSAAQWQDGTQRVLQTIAPSVGQIHLLRSTPYLPFDAPACLAPRGWLYQQIAAADRCSAPATQSGFDEVHQALQTAASAFGNVSMLDMTEAVCPQGYCRAALGGRIVFRDQQHLSASFAASLGEEMARRLRLDELTEP